MKLKYHGISSLTDRFHGYVVNIRSNADQLFFRSKTPVLIRVFRLQGIDINHKYDRKVRRTEPKSQDVYLRLLVKVRLSMALTTS